MSIHLKGPGGVMAYPRGFAYCDDPSLLHPISGPSMRAKYVLLDSTAPELMSDFIAWLYPGRVQQPEL